MASGDGSPPGPALPAHQPVPVPRAPPHNLCRQLATRLLAPGKTPPNSHTLGCITRLLTAEPSADRSGTSDSAVGRARHERTGTLASVAARLTDRHRPAPRAVRPADRAAHRAHGRAGPAGPRTSVKPRPCPHSHA